MKKIILLAAAAATMLASAAHAEDAPSTRVILECTGKTALGDSVTKSFTVDPAKGLIWWFAAGSTETDAEDLVASPTKIIAKEISNGTLIRGLEVNRGSAFFHYEDIHLAINGTCTVKPTTPSPAMKF